jgi:hypothetical protein
MQGAVPTDHVQPSCVAHVVWSALSDAHVEGVPPQAVVHAQPLWAEHVAIAANVVQVEAVPEQVPLAPFQEQPDCAVQVCIVRKL